MPTKLTQVLCEDKQSFIIARQALDQVVVRFIDELNESDFLQTLSYKNTKGDCFSKPFSMLVQHFFNHQTHHRGQVTTLLNKSDIDIGETGLLILIPNTDH